MLRLSEALEKITKIFGFVSALLAFLMIGLVLWDALARYIFKQGSIALQELEWHFFAAMFLLAIAFTLKHKSHVQLDIFYQAYSQRAKDLLDLGVNAFFIIPFSLLIIYYGYDFVAMSFTQNEVSDSGGLAYRFIIKSFIITGFAGLIIQAVAEILKTLKKLSS